MTDAELDIFIERELTEMAVKILEVIKQEILNLEDEETDLDDDYEFGKYQGYKCCELLIGKHIEAIKGENQ